LVIRFATKDDAFGNLTKLHPERIRSLLRRAGRAIQHHRRMRVAGGLQDGGEALGAVWELHLWKEINR
jgi:hypothetical protein